MHLSSVSIAPLSGKMMVELAYIYISHGQASSRAGQRSSLRSASVALRSASAGFRLDSTQPCSRFSVRNSIIRARSLLNPRVTRRYRGFLGFFVGALQKTGHHDKGSDCAAYRIHSLDRAHPRHTRFQIFTSSPPIISPDPEPIGSSESPVDVSMPVSPDPADSRRNEACILPSSAEARSLVDVKMPCGFNAIMNQ